MVDQSVIHALHRCVERREWGQFRTPASPARSVAIEAGELLEFFEWSDNDEIAEVAAHLADVLTYCLLLADRLGLDPERIMLDKLEQKEHKYPVDKARGRSTRYDRLSD